MFSVKTPEEVQDILTSEFPQRTEPEKIPLDHCVGRVLSETITAEEFVPGFRRSTVDGYSVHAADTFGCSDSIPALLILDGDIQMGEASDFPCPPGHCVYVPTGGAIPDNADGVVMIEFTENYGDGTICINTPISPGTNLIHKGDDVYPGKTVLPSGRKLTVSDIGALAAMGITQVSVLKKPRIGILSTGDELIPVSETPKAGQVRDVNSTLLNAVCRERGADTRLYGIIKDEIESLKTALCRALEECDIILISGGSSVGVRDATAQAIESYGNLLVHGVALKPGKPTILGKINEKPVFGLPGHPVAAFFVCMLFVRPLIDSFTGQGASSRTVEARLTEAINTNHGRSECVGVKLVKKEEKRLAEPIRTKSGLISTLAGADGYIIIPRDCEGLASGTSVNVTLFSTEPMNL